jgi:mono/diheme cytochrome c family protein
VTPDAGAAHTAVPAFVAKNTICKIQRMIGQSVRKLPATFMMVALIGASAINPLRAQDTQGGEEQRVIAQGKDIFKTKATCQFCHKWDASGDQGYGGNALSLRATKLSPAQIAETVKCGRPGTGMPYHDPRAYTDKRCYGVTREQLGNAMPPEPNAFLNDDEINAVVKYLFAKDVGRGPSTYQDCVEFWGTETRQCEPMKPH